MEKTNFTPAVFFGKPTHCQTFDHTEVVPSVKAVWPMHKKRAETLARDTTQTLHGT